MWDVHPIVAVPGNVCVVSTPAFVQPEGILLAVDQDGKKEQGEQRQHRSMHRVIGFGDQVLMIKL